MVAALLDASVEPPYTYTSLVPFAAGISDDDPAIRSFLLRHGRAAAWATRYARNRVIGTARKSIYLTQQKLVMNES